MSYVKDLANPLNYGNFLNRETPFALKEYAIQEGEIVLKLASEHIKSVEARDEMHLLGIKRHEPIVLDASMDDESGHLKSSWQYGVEYEFHYLLSRDGAVVKTYNIASVSSFVFKLGSHVDLLDSKFSFIKEMD